MPYPSAIVSILFASLLVGHVLARARCECPRDLYAAYDTKACCEVNNLGPSIDPQLSGTNDLTMKCAVTEEYIANWPRMGSWKKSWYLSKPEFKGMKPEDIPLPTEVDCLLECPTEDGYPNPWGEDKAKFGWRSYFLEHGRHIEGDIGYCYREPTHEEVATQRKWMDENRSDEPHRVWKSQVTHMEPETGFMDPSTSHVFCVDYRWSS